MRVTGATWRPREAKPDSLISSRGSSCYGGWVSEGTDDRKELSEEKNLKNKKRWECGLQTRREGPGQPAQEERGRQDPGRLLEKGKHKEEQSMLPTWRFDWGRCWTPMQTAFRSFWGDWVRTLFLICRWLGLWGWWACDWMWLRGPNAGRGLLDAGAGQRVCKLTCFRPPREAF